MASRWKIQMQLKGALPPVRRQMKTVLMAVAQEARKEWVRMARSELYSTASSYIIGIQEPTIRGSTVEIKLISTKENPLPDMIENGCGPFDMKPGLLRSPKAKKSKKGGRYITVPLYMKTSGARGASPPVMPASIYKSAKQLGFGQSLSLSKTYEGYGMRTRLSADIKRWGHYTWKTSPFQGITKVRRYPGLVPLGLPRELLASYMTFRRVSNKSDPASWIHPGFRSRRFIERTAEKINDILPRILDSVYVGV